MRVGGSFPPAGVFDAVEFVMRNTQTWVVWFNSTDSSCGDDPKWDKESHKLLSYEMVGAVPTSAKSDTGYPSW